MNRKEYIVIHEATGYSVTIGGRMHCFTNFAEAQTFCVRKECELLNG